MSIEFKQYLDSLQDDIDIINLNNRNLNVLPNLSRFKNLRYLHCSNNNLTSLPKLNETLIELWCDNNKLISLPKLNTKLKLLHCSNNNLTLLPEFNENLVDLHCLNNKLTSFPDFNHEFNTILLHIDFENNEFCDNSKEIIQINTTFKKISKIYHDTFYEKSNMKKYYDDDDCGL